MENDEGKKVNDEGKKEEKKDKKTGAQKLTAGLSATPQDIKPIEISKGFSFAGALSRMSAPERISFTTLLCDSLDATYDKNDSEDPEKILDLMEPLFGNDLRNSLLLMPLVERQFLSDVMHRCGYNVRDQGLHIETDLLKLYLPQIQKVFG